jgi:hypothetical protein
LVWRSGRDARRALNLKNHQALPAGAGSHKSVAYSINEADFMSRQFS